MNNLEKSFNNLLVLEKKAEDIYARMINNGLDKESLKKLEWIRLEEVGHIKKAEALIVLNRGAYGRRGRVVKKGGADFFKKDFLFKRKLLESVNQLINSKIETIGLLAAQGKMNRVKQEMVDKIMHDLKNPLTITKWLTESLLTSEEDLSRKQKEMVQKIESSNQSIISFVEELLLAERIEQDSRHKKNEFDLVELAKDVTRELDSLFESRGQRINFKSPNSIIVKSSQDSLRTIISNLLTNASQYGLKKDIDLEIKRKKDNILIIISDKGIGIPKDEQSNIFKKFFRTTNAKSVYEKGSGLGLYIVKALIDKIGAKIWFDSKKGKTTFYVSLKG